MLFLTATMSELYELSRVTDDCVIDCRLLVVIRQGYVTNNNMTVVV